MGVPGATAGEIERRMREAGMPDPATRAFLRLYELLVRRDTGLLGRDRIRPLSRPLPDAGALADHRGRGEALLDATAVIKLNGGLGTSMGLEGPKSLLPVRDGLTFLDLIARNVLALRERTGARLPLLFMNSFRTDAPTRAALARHPELELPGLPLTFLQHRVPKIDAATLEPVRWPGDPELEWCPPGHGDLYTALGTSGTLERLLDAGIEWAFVSNADNLGATPDPGILGWMAAEGLAFVMEAADRTPADRKGGHLAELRDGRLVLREAAQCPPEEREEFQDVARYRHFNTNNLWLHLPTLAAALEEHGGFLPLPPIFNRKTVDPRDPESPEVIQLETAMGAAISVLPRAAAVRVPRSRFSPVKTTDDLLAVRSDAYELTDDWRLVLSPRRAAPPEIRLDPAFYRLVDAFDARFPAGPPSLLPCERLEVRGDVTFGAGIVVRGRVVITAPAPARVADGTVLEGDVRLG